MRYRNRKIKEKEERQSADVSGWKWQACEIVVCAGGVQDSANVALFSCLVFVQLGLCAKMIDDVL